MKQPDFQRLFFDHFGRVPRKVTYSVRSDSNRYHDLVFLSSLVHDARFARSDLVLRGTRLTIPINRDCWELGTVKTRKGKELHIAESRLTISSVKDIEWRFTRGSAVDRAELCIGAIWLDHEAHGNLRNLVIDGYDWRCTLALDDDQDIKVRLVDLSMPYLYSRRNRGRKKLRTSAGIPVRSVRKQCLRKTKVNAASRVQKSETAELLSIPGFRQSVRRSVGQMRKRETVSFEDVFIDMPE